MPYNAWGLCDGRGDDEVLGTYLHYDRALLTTPSTGQAALAVPLAETPWAADEEEPHPNSMAFHGMGRDNRDDYPGPLKSAAAQPAVRSDPRPAARRRQQAPASRTTPLRQPASRTSGREHRRPTVFARGEPPSWPRKLSATSAAVHGSASLASMAPVASRDSGAAALFACTVASEPPCPVSRAGNRSAASDPEVASIQFRSGPRTFSDVAC